MGTVLAYADGQQDDWALVLADELVHEKINKMDLLMVWLADDSRLALDDSWWWRTSQSTKKEDAYQWGLILTDGWAGVEVAGAGEQDVGAGRCGWHWMCDVADHDGTRVGTSDMELQPNKLRVRTACE